MQKEMGLSCVLLLVLMLPASALSGELSLTSRERRSLDKQLIDDEGKINKIYADSNGVLHFGIGHKIIDGDPEYGKPPGTSVTPERVTEAYNKDLNQVLQDTFTWSSDCNTWPSEVKEIIANMMYNLGLTKMNKFVDLKAAIKIRDWDKAADAMVNSTWAGQVGARATRLIERMRNVKNTSKVSGDPHFITCDGKRFAFGGVCSYTLMRGQDFNIISEFKRCRRFRRHVSCVDSITITYLGKEYKLDRARILHVEGIKEDIPFSSPEVNAKHQNKITLSNRIDIQWDGRTVLIKTPSTFNNKVEGLTGDCDGDPDNDFKTPDGNLVDNVADFGKSWKLNNNCTD